MTQDIRKKELERTSKDGKPAQLLVCNPIKLMWVTLDRSLKAKQHVSAMHLWGLCWVELNKITFTCTFDHLCTWCTWRWGLRCKSCVNTYSIVRNVITRRTLMPIDQNKTWKRSKITTKTPDWIQTVAKQVQCVRMRNSPSICLLTGALSSYNAFMFYLSFKNRKLFIKPWSKNLNMTY